MCVAIISWAARNAAECGERGRRAERVVKEREVVRRQVKGLLEEVVEEELAGDDRARPDAARGKAEVEAAEAELARLLGGPSRELREVAAGEKAAREAALQTAISKYEGVLTLRAGAARPEIAKREALEDLDAAALAALQRAVSQMSHR